MGMSAYLPSMAPIAVLCFLATALVLGSLLLVGLYGLFTKSGQHMASAGIGAGIVLASYCAVLLGFSLFSRDVDLSAGMKKFFCEIDCHLAYQVDGVSTEKAVGGESDQIVSTGEFMVVELRTWFDPSTISPKRGNSLLTPNGREAIVTDNEGHGFRPSPQGDKVLEAERRHSTPLTTPLRPGESYTSYLVFEVPARAQGLRLWLRSDDEVGAVLWGNERSPLHGKVRFRLDPGVPATQSSP
jgi:hypothetical protein